MCKSIIPAGLAELFRTCLLEGEPALGDTITWDQQLNAILQRRATGDLTDIIAAAMTRCSTDLLQVYAETSPRSAHPSNYPGLPAP